MQFVKDKRHTLLALIMRSQLIEVIITVGSDPSFIFVNAVI